eukprot:CAMPEP_0201534130 /NCGR_PEP_ID=MMETSP0161_2-20130828/55356_1 /ASSEMBLY_ACC=CAM_ASM_000251 /TAXON_ID=180227 /ORGANISM="Neoparamoeba aestuarina, Strain SoJaBio B1-5/56/2" /LENGTH=100 /DNA_ID=CAMNT_0047938607 /DNA_START=371 /DNA_END=673 /DNA_ORIENTATION=-
MKRKTKTITTDGFFNKGNPVLAISSAEIDSSRSTKKSINDFEYLEKQYQSHVTAAYQTLMEKAIAKWVLGTRNSSRISMETFFRSTSGLVLISSVVLLLR